MSNLNRSRITQRIAGFRQGAKELAELGSVPIRLTAPLESVTVQRQDGLKGQELVGRGVLLRSVPGKEAEFSAEGRPVTEVGFRVVPPPGYTYDRQLRHLSQMKGQESANGSEIILVNAGLQPDGRFGSNRMSHKADGRILPGVQIGMNGAEVAVLQPSRVAKPTDDAGLDAAVTHALAVSVEAGGSSAALIIVRGKTEDSCVTVLHRPDEQGRKSALDHPVLRSAVATGGHVEVVPASFFPAEPECAERIGWMGSVFLPAPAEKRPGTVLDTPAGPVYRVPGLVEADIVIDARGVVCDVQQARKSGRARFAHEMETPCMPSELRLETARSVDSSEHLRMAYFEARKATGRTGETVLAGPGAPGR